MTAVQREPRRRYPSMAAFAADLRNLLEFRPIAAKPATLATRLTKLLRRRRTFVASTAAVVVVAVAGVWVGRACSMQRNPSRDPVGRVRVGIEDDTVVEFRAAGGAGSAWREATRPTAGAVELPLGEYEMRIQRRNHFPVLVEHMVAVEEGQEAVIAVRRPQPIERWSAALHIGAGRAEPRVLVDASGAKQLVLKRQGALTVFEAHSGRTATELPFFSEESGTWAALTGGLDPPAIRLVGISKLKGKSRLFGTDLSGRMRHFAPEEFGSGVDRLLVVPDVDDDGIDDVVIALENGELLKFSPEKSLVAWRRKIGERPPARLVRVPGTASPGVAPWLAVVHDDGRIAAIDVRDGAQLGACDAGFAPRHAAPLRLAGEHVLVLTSEDGIHIADPKHGSALHRISDHHAVDVAVLAVDGSALVDEEIVVLGNGRLFDLDARSGRERWSTDHNLGWGLLAIGALDSLPGLEIVLAESNGIVHAFSGADGTESWRFHTAGAFSFPPQIDDLDGDGLGEVIVISMDERVRVLSGSAEHRIWTHETSWPIGTRPVVATDDGGAPIVVIGTAGGAASFPYDGAMWGTAVHGIVAATGAEAWPPVRAEQSFLWCPELADLDADGSLDTFAVDRAGRLVGIRASDGRTIFKVRFDPAELAPVRPCIAELDATAGAEILTVRIRGERPFLETCRGAQATTTWSRELVAPAITIAARAHGRDGRSAVACGMRDGRVLVVDGATGAVLAELTPGGGSKSALTFGDVTGDALDDLVVSIHDEGAATPSRAMVKVYDGATWAPLWSAAKAESSMGVEAATAIADVDGDGELDVVVADWEGSLSVFAGRDGTPLWDRPAKVGRQAYFGSPAIGDLDGDGASEIVVGGTDRFVVIVDGRTGRVLRRCGVESEIFGSPLLIDIDGKGALDIVVGSDEGRLHAITGELPNPR
jgi:outer membrane protein assembly factor BamB